MLNQYRRSHGSLHRRSRRRPPFGQRWFRPRAIWQWAFWIGILVGSGGIATAARAEPARPALREMAPFCPVNPPTGEAVERNLTADRRDEDDRRREEVLDLLEEVHLRVEQVVDPLHRIAIQAKAAGLLWEFDPALARSRFESLRTWIEQQSAETFPRDRARAELLRALFPRDAALARSWLTLILDPPGRAARGPESVTADSQPTSKSLEARLEGQTPDLRTLNQLADRLLEVDAALAGEVLGASFERGYSYPAHAALRRLSQQDPSQGARLARQLLAQLPAYLVSEALTAAQFLFEFAFPTPLSGSSPGASSREIQSLYLASARQVLQRSLALPSGPFSSPREQQAWEVNQALLGIILDVFGEGQFSPQDRATLDRLEASLPPPLQGFRQVVRTRRDTHLSTPSPSGKGADSAQMGGESRLLDRVGHALSKGDLAGAKEILRQMENTPQEKDSRPLVEQLVLHASVRDTIAKGQLAAALPLIKSLRDPFQRAALLGNLIRSVREAPEPQFALHLTDMLRAETAGFPCSPQKILLILPLVPLANPWDLIEESISCINMLPAVEAQLFPLDTFQSPFRYLAKDSWPQTLEAISTIRSPALELLARLAASEGVLLPSRLELQPKQKESSDGKHDR